MSVRKRNRYVYPAIDSDYNDTSKNNPSHDVDEFTNYALREITLEDLDASVWQEFNNRFIVANKQVNLLMLDADIASLQFENPTQLDKTKGFLNFPYFTMWRNKTAPTTRISPSNKPSIYIVPQKKAQGIVYEEWTMPPPVMLQCDYVFKFMTTYRQYTNEMEQYMLDFFKNKRAIILLDRERFEISPASSFELAELDVADRESVNGQSLYVLTWTLKLFAYTRKLSDIQKKERPNSYILTVVEKDKQDRSEQITQFADRYPRVAPEKPSDLI